MCMPTVDEICGWQHIWPFCCTVHCQPQKLSTTACITEIYLQNELNVVKSLRAFSISLSLPPSACITEIYLQNELNVVKSLRGLLLTENYDHRDPRQSQKLARSKRSENKARQSKKKRKTKKVSPLHKASSSKKTMVVRNYIVTMTTHYVITHSLCKCRYARVQQGSGSQSPYSLRRSNHCRLLRSCWQTTARRLRPSTLFRIIKPL